MNICKIEKQILKKYISFNSRRPRRQEISQKNLTSKVRNLNMRGLK